MDDVGHLQRLVETYSKVQNEKYVLSKPIDEGGETFFSVIVDSDQNAPPVKSGRAAEVVDWLEAETKGWVEAENG